MTSQSSVKDEQGHSTRGDSVASSQPNADDQSHCPGVPVELTWYGVLWRLVFFLALMGSVIAVGTVMIPVGLCVWAAELPRMVCYLLCRGPLDSITWAMDLLKYDGYVYAFKRLEGEFRLLQLNPGTEDAPIDCILLCSWSRHTEYQAVSYTWGSNRGIGHFIRIDGRPFLVTPTLNRALHYLRYADQPRLLWVDAVCINQRGHTEKSHQVPKMRRIFATASRVVVWLDVDETDRDISGDIEPLFTNLRGLADADKEGISARLAQLPESQRKALGKLFQLPWWERLWVIQEVTASRRTVIQCRNFSVEWDELVVFCLYPEIALQLGIPQRAIWFVKQVHWLRNSTVDLPYGLLGLAYRFRHSKATDDRDRLFALKNLILAPENTLGVVADYNKLNTSIFIAFTKEAIRKYKTLNVLVRLEFEPGMKQRYFWSFGKRDSSWPSWVSGWPDAGLENLRRPLWDGGLALETGLLPADGICQDYAPVKCRTDLADPNVIAVQGFTVDVIKQTGGMYRGDRSIQSKRAILSKWYKLAHQLCGLSGKQLDRQFTSTLMAGVDSDRLISGDDIPVIGPELLSKIDVACSGRRLIVTRNHTMGLGHSMCKKGDLVCRLTGLPIPYILRHARHSGPTFFHSTNGFCFWGLDACCRAKHMQCCIPDLHRIVGQAYLADVELSGTNQNVDIEAGSVVLKEFFLE
jgi:Heterokaryon incompatibility protein (HET)